MAEATAFHIDLANGCKGCTFEHDSCCVADTGVKTSGDDEPAPDDCPLRAGPIIVTMKPRKEETSEP